MFIATLLIIAKIWKLLRCPWVGKWIKKMWYTHTLEYYAATKRNENTPFATRMDLEGIMLSEISQAEKDK